MTKAQHPRVPRPARKGEWQPRFANGDAADGWKELCRTAPNQTQAAYDAVCANPSGHSSRQGQLKYELATRTLKDRTYPQWQYEVTAGGRVWYLIDEPRKTLWLVEAGVAHPKATDRRR